jgi:hypothetical protein
VIRHSAAWAITAVMATGLLSLAFAQEKALRPLDHDLELTAADDNNAQQSDNSRAKR